MRKVSALKKKLAEKTASRKLDWGAVQTGLAIAGGTAALGLAGRAVGSGVSGAFQKLQANRMFNDLQQRYPEIKRHKDARKYFDLIIAYAPSLMRHHAAVGDFLRRQLEYPMSSVEFIKQLADLEATVAKTESMAGPARFGQSLEQAGGYIPQYSPERK